MRTLSNQPVRPELPERPIPASAAPIEPLVGFGWSTLLVRAETRQAAIDRAMRSALNHSFLHQDTLVGEDLGDMLARTGFVHDPQPSPDGDGAWAVAVASTVVAHLCPVDPLLDPSAPRITYMLNESHTPVCAAFLGPRPQSLPPDADDGPWLAAAFAQRERLALATAASGLATLAPCAHPRRPAL